MKKFLLVLCMALCVLGLTACSSAGKKDNTENYDKESVEADFKMVFEQWDSMEFEQVIEVNKAAWDDATLNLWTGWLELSEKLGEFDSMGKITVSESGHVVSATARCKYSKRDMEFSVTFNDETGQVMFEDISAELILTIGEKLENAGMNTLMGMGTVFVVLIFISIIIGLLKYIPSIIDKLSGNGKTATTEASIENKVVEVSEEEDLTDDTELVAVITAAIMTSMGDEAPADGLVVRSIRKVNKNKWQNA